MTGLSCARQAVAKHHNTPEAPLTENVTKHLQGVITLIRTVEPSGTGIKIFD